MAQIKKAVSVVNNGQTVVVAGIDLSARIRKNHIFMVDGLLVPYTVAADAIFNGTDTVVTLTGAYQGPSNSTAPGVFAVDATYPDMIPTISQGDVGTAAVFTQAMYRLQDMVTSVSPAGLAVYSQMHDDVSTIYDAVDAAETHVSTLEQSAQASATAAAASKSAAATSETNAAASKADAASSATKAAASESSALSSKGDAATSASNAATSAKSAQNWATQTDTEVVAGQGYGAKKYANDASKSASDAATSASTVATKADNASASAAAANTSAGNAKTSETNAKTSETKAATSETNSRTSEGNAAASATAAQTSANDAAASAVAASGSANASSASSNSAKTSETNAAASASTADAKASLASTSADQAKSSETNAASSASSALSSAADAAASATNAGSSAAAAAASETKAATSESNAASSASSAAGSASSLQAALAAFRSTFLGRLASDPTVDGNGGALGDGMEYFNTTTETLRVYTAGSWGDYDASAQVATTNANLAASNAAGSASAASTSETNAAASATASSTSADNAKTSETNAAASASAASTSADHAATSASTASTAAGNASTSAGTAQDWATKTDAKVGGVDYSAKYYAQLAASAATAATTGQIQTDWNETDSGSKSYILHKPTNVSAFGNDAGYITATASITGNAATATKLATPRTINGVDFDGSKSITINAVDATAREPAIAAGSASYFWKGNKTWAALVSADVTGALGFTPYNATNPAGYITSAASITGTASNVTGTVAIANGGTGATTAATARANLGLTNVDNTSDADKSVLSAGKLTTPRSINGVPFDGTAPITINAVDSTAREPAIATGTASYFWKGDKTWAALAASDVTGALGFTPYSAANPAGYITAASSITGNAANVTGTVALANGGTGGTTAADARANLGLAKVAASGAYGDLDGKPALAPVATSGAKADVGLGRADNTADLEKPVSTAQQAALDLKADRATTYTKSEVDAKASTSGAKSFFFASFG